MEQRLRLVQGGQSRAEKRAADRRRIAVPGQIVWKDAKGTTRMAAVVTRDVSDNGVSVDCLGGMPIPLFRLVYFQVDREARTRLDLPAALRKSNVLSAVFRVGPCRQATGAPSEYALRMLVEPERVAPTATVVNESHAHADGIVAAGPPSCRWPAVALTLGVPAVRPTHGRFRRPSIPPSHPSEVGCRPRAGTKERLQQKPLDAGARRSPDFEVLMIDRRRFVQSMLALGAATGVRPSTVLLARPPADELRDLADAALVRRATKAGASYADIRINRYRNQFIFTRDRRVQNIVNTEDYGFGVRVIVDGTWGFASSSIVTKDEIARVAAQAVGDRAGPTQTINAEPVRLAPVERLRRRRGTRRSRRTRSRCRCSPSSICCCRSTRRR